MTYSLIIPSYNSSRTIRPCLRSLIEQDFSEDVDILVVDSSSDATPEIIRREFPQVRLFHLEEKTEPGRARNLGIQEAQGEILCFLDSDCVAQPGWLAGIAQAHADPDYAAVGGAVLNGNPEQLIGWAGYLAEFREFFPCGARRAARHCASCNISYKRWVFEKYGLFPNDYYPQEDLVFNLRLYRARDTLLFDPAIQVAHLNKTSLKHFFRHQFRIGSITSEVLRHFPFLSGGAIAASRFLTLLAAPLLPLAKFLNTWRVAAQSPTSRRRFLQIAPLLFCGLLVWGLGFVRGTWLPRRVPRNRKALISLEHPLLWEIERWSLNALSLIPGELGVFLRKWLIPFRCRGDNIRIMEQVWIERPQNLTLGENVRVNRGAYLNAFGGVDIGSNVGIGPGALVYSVNHNFREKDRVYMDQGSNKAPVKIEDDVWIAAHALIMPGVTLRTGTVVAAGAVVTKDTSPYSIVAGIPAQPIGCRT